MAKAIHIHVHSSRRKTQDAVSSSDFNFHHRRYVEEVRKNNTTAAGKHLAAATAIQHYLENSHDKDAKARAEKLSEVARNNY